MWSSFTKLEGILPRIFHGLRYDQRLGMSHLAVYMALMEQWYEDGFQVHLETYAKTTARLAKVSLATCYGCLSDLDCYGYISYQASFDPRVGSRIEFRMDSDRSQVQAVLPSLRGQRTKFPWLKENGYQ